MFMYCGIN